MAVHVYPAFLYADHPLASVNGAFNAVTIESPAITEITLSGPGAGGIQTASAVLGDVISAMIPPPSLVPPAVDVPLVTDTEFSFYLHLEVADRPGVLARVAEILGHAGRVDQVGGAEGPRRRGAARDGHAPGARVEVPRGGASCSRGSTSCASRRA